MDGVRKCFHVNVDMSKLLDETPGTNFIMLIDETKMTIVYELIEWIRWMFSLKECVYLTHENSIIHELEDVRILEGLKKFELKRCKARDCIHKEMHNKLLSSIDFFVHWNRVKVPKMFVEKLTQINQKQHFVNQKARSLNASCESQSMKENNLNDKCSKGSLNDRMVDFYNPLNGDPSTIEDFCNNDTESCQSDKSFGNRKQKFFNGDDECHKSESLVNKNVQVQAKKVKSNENNLSNNKPLEKNLNSSTADSIVNKNSFECPETAKYSKTNTDKKNVNSSSVLKRNKAPKPFSLAELVADLRKKTENQTDKVESTRLQDSSSVSKEENEMKSELFSDSLAGESPCIRKRRKRVRKSKSKKKKETDFEQAVFKEQVSISNNELISFPAKKKSNHIRFYSSSEEDEEVSNELKNDEVVERVNNIQENVKRYDTIQNSEINLGKLSLATSEEKHVLSSAVMNSSSENIDNAMECMPAENNQSHCRNESKILGDKHSELLHNGTNQFSTGYESYIDYHTFNDEIASLKNKFPTPVIIERFY